MDRHGWGFARRYPGCTVRSALVVVTVHAAETITRPVLRAQYATGVDPYRDPECRACPVLPICGGGCAHRRLLVKYHGREGIE